VASFISLHKMFSVTEIITGINLNPVLSQNLHQILYGGRASWYRDRIADLGGGAVCFDRALLQEKGFIVASL